MLRSNQLSYITLLQIIAKALLAAYPKGLPENSHMISPLSKQSFMDLHDS